MVGSRNVVDPTSAALNGGFRLSHGYRTVIARLSHGYRTDIARLSHGYSNLIARLSHGYRNLIAALSCCYAFCRTPVCWRRRRRWWWRLGWRSFIVGWRGRLVGKGLSSHHNRGQGGSFTGTGATESLIWKRASGDDSSKVMRVIGAEYDDDDTGSRCSCSRHGRCRGGIARGHLQIVDGVNSPTRRWKTWTVL